MHHIIQKQTFVQLAYVLTWNVKLLGQNPIVWKIIDNVIVVILNYVLSKVMVFKDHE